MDKVLIIDDSRLDTIVLADILKDEYEVITALSGEEGIRLAIVEKPVLILLDIVMPGIDGFEILEQLKGNEVTKDIPVVFLTALSDEATEEKGFMKGAMDYIKKPFNAHIVRARVRNHVKLCLYMRTIETQMSIDSLTGAYNRRAFENQLALYWEKAIKQKEPLSLFIADIDFFKMVNDTYGHGEGDVVLKTTVSEMKKVLDSENIFFARYGGEEFAVISYGLSSGVTQLMAESVRKRIEELHIANENSLVSSFLTVSIGGCTMRPKDGQISEKIVNAADSMLYQAKNSGRNRICWEII
ncbi:MAG TPA: diguanylate cyclase [Lachnospiraceae bacterium]|nr:diguanylate cyclase [Lachnospiraceae bacterium]